MPDNRGSRTTRRRVAVETLHKQERFEKRSRVLMVACVLTVVAVFVGLCVWIVRTGNNPQYDAPAHVYGGAITVAHVDGELKVVKPTNISPLDREGAVDTPKLNTDGKKFVEVFQDYQCPGCAKLSRTHGGDIAKLTESGEIVTSIHPVSFLDHTTGENKYSSRALNAVFATVDSGQGDKILTIDAHLFAHQPPEGSDGMSDEDLIGVLEKAGVDMDKELSTKPGMSVRQAVKDVPFEKYVQVVTKHTLSGDLKGTPTVKVNGKSLNKELGDQNAFREALSAVAVF